MKHADKLIVQALCQSVEGLPTEEAIATLFKRGLFFPVPIRETSGP